MSGKDELAMTIAQTISIPPMLTINDVTAILRVHHTITRRLIANGELRARKVGGQWRIPASALIEYMGDGAPQ
jgi:excisionase family DNA binding protein